MGTVGYMAPEQVTGKVADYRADIFAFGAILYEMLTGRRAFQKPTSAETMSAILNEDPSSISQLAPSLPPALQRVAQRCLEKNPEQRFQSASDLAFALEALSDSGALPASTTPAHQTTRFPAVLLWAGATVLMLLFAGFGIFRLLSPPKIPVDPSTWVRLTSLPDSVTQPALSPDGRMITFVRGPSTFAGPGQIYVKMLPEGEPVQLTRDGFLKMSPVFSPDGSRIAYTTVDSTRHWDTWVLPVLGGQPQLWLPNASGLVWWGRKVLFSEIRENKLHMGIFAADESRAGEREVYLPASDRGMAHRSFPSPDGKWALVVEMDYAVWRPCKLVSLDGSSPPRLIGPAPGSCTFAAWSPDGKWMYFTSGTSGTFHIWRQRFPDGRAEQMTAGPTEEEGIVVAPDGRSFITAVGSRQSSVWVRDSTGKRQVSLEGFSYDPKFTPDGKRLCYRVVNGASDTAEASELRVVDLDSGRVQPLLPGLAIEGLPDFTYDISPDSRQVVVTALDGQGKHRLWLAPLDRTLPPRQIPNVEGDNPLFGLSGEIFFRGVEGNYPYAYRVRQDGGGLRKVIAQPVAVLEGISPDGQWLTLKLAGMQGSSTAAVSLHQDASVHLITAGGFGSTDVFVRWSRNMRSMYIRLSVTEDPFESHKAYRIPLPPGQTLPEISVAGLQSESEIAKLPGAVMLDEFDCPGTTPETNAFVRMTVQRNLFRVPLP
jgi:Tol biopolymer transport system component